MKTDRAQRRRDILHRDVRPCAQSWQHRSHRLAVLFVTLWTWLTLSALGVAQFEDEGGTITTKNVSGGPLQIAYYCERGGSDAQGYLHVNVSAIAPVSARERNLEVICYAHCVDWPSQTSVAYHLPVRLPEGSSGVQASLPIFLAGGVTRNTATPLYWDVSVTEDGRDIEMSRILSGATTGSPVRAPVRINTESESVYHIAKRYSLSNNILRLVDDTPPSAQSVPGAPTSGQYQRNVPASGSVTDIRNELARLVVAGVGGDAHAAMRASSVSPIAFGVSQDLAKLCTVRSISTAPDRWQYYLQFGLVVIDRGTLDKLRSNRAAVAQALAQFIAAGGSFMLIGDERLDSRRSIDEWLTSREHRAGDRDSDWQGVHTQVFAWWLVDPQGLPAIATVATAPDFGGAMPSTPGSAAAYSTQPYSQPIYGQPTYGQPGYGQPGYAQPNAPQSKPLSGQGLTLSELMEVKEFIRVRRRGAESGSVLSGYARDCVVALESYIKAEFGGSIEFSQELAATLFHEDVSSTSGFSAPPTVGVKVDEAVWNLRNSLEQKVIALEGQWIGGCATREHVLGRVAVVEPGLDSFPVDQLRAVRTFLQSSFVSSLNSTNDGSWSWRNLIPSVGKPPVWMFCTIVLLFGLILGPGLLILTGWMRRRSLLIFLVPFVSLVATLLIVTYEVLHEGFDTHIRVSSVLAVDEQSGQGFAWSRQTYFSGWPPRGGLKIPHEAYFRPVIAETKEQQRQAVEPRRAAFSHITVGQAELTWNGWLRSREQQQLLIGHPAKVSVPLTAKRLDPKRVLIKNVSGQQLPFAMLRDGDDGLYLVGALAKDAELTCVRQTIEEAAGMIARFRADSIPDLPEGLSGMRMVSRGRLIAVPNSDTSASFELLNRVWNTYLSENSIMPKYGFVTVLQNSDAVIVPLAGDVTNSQHLVVGRLVW